MKPVAPARPAGAATAAPARRARARYVAESGPQPVGQAAVPAEVVEALLHHGDEEPTLLRAEIMREEQA